MIRVSNIKVDVKTNDYMTPLLKKINVNKEKILKLEINKRSIDARKDVFYVYEIDVYLKNENKIKLTNEIKKTQKEKYEFIPGNTNIKDKIIVVGSGPAGLFCAYELAKNNYDVTIIERGEKVENRIETVEKFWQTNELNENSNVQFGEGGAGTFSDGKLTTGIKDNKNRIKEVLNTFVTFGAPEEILFDHMPHIGTDKLRNVVKNMREKILSYGGKIRYNTKLTNINIENNHIKSITINDNEEIECDRLVLALGHSARDTFYMLKEKGLELKNKPFAVGLRVCHNQSLIDQNQYKEYAKFLPHASYKLTYNENSRGVYSFCMCPGGYVVNSSSIKNHLVINGMSNYDRESKVANSAIIVTINENDYGTNLFDGVKFQQELERKAYELCNGKIPVQKLIDYKNNKISTSFGKIIPQVKGSYDFEDLNKLFNNEINGILKRSFESFDKKIHGFNDDETVLLGVESRTSSPIKMIRDDNLESNIKGIYPCGEGAGYAGGITSAAVDGIKVFESIAK